MVASDAEAIKPPNLGVPFELKPGETQLCRTHDHWIILFWPGVFAVLFCLPGVVALIAVPARGGSTGGTLLLAATGLFLLAVAVAIGFTAYLRWEYRETTLTNRRLIFLSGIIRTEMTSIDLDGVESAALQSTLLGKALGYENVVVSQVHGSVKSIKNIPCAGKFYRLLRSQLNPGAKQETNAEAD